MASMHRDVLSAPIPDSQDGKERLVAELKNRAKGAVKSKAWPDALLLYERAVEITPDDATLHCNQSLVHFNMGKWEEAKDAAETAIVKDFDYVKAYWRAAQALAKLHRYEKAYDILETSMKLDPNNKAIKKEMAKIQSDDEAYKLKMAMEPPEEKKTEHATADPFAKTKTEKMDVDKELKDEKTEKMDVDNNNNNSNSKVDSTFTKSDHTKGYKIVNGKKTTFFHNELTEEAKKLIGDIAPKRLDPTAAAAAPTEKKDTSAWNTAGTWEERDVTSWAKESLEGALLRASYTLDESSPAPDAKATVTKVTKCDGNASFATVRGKKRYIYEFLVTFEWKLETADQSDTAEGTMTFPDFDGTCPVGEGYDLGPYEVKECSDANLKPILDRFVRNGGLRDCIHTTLDDWVRLFKAKY